MHFYKEDCELFKKWLDLNLEGITWQNKFEKEFDTFWEIFFLDGLSLKQLIQRYNYSGSILKKGPLYSWFKWLKAKNLCYFFIFKNVSLAEMAKESDMDIRDLANLFRNFFIEKFPLFEDFFNEKFQISSVINENLNITFNDLERELNINRNFKGTAEDDIMISLEVTLFSQWDRFLQKIKKDFIAPKGDFEEIRNKNSSKIYFKFFREVLFLLLMGLVLIYTLKEINEWLEDRLSKKIRLFEPDFLWNETLLVFKKNPLASKKIEMELKEMEKIKALKTLEESFEREERFEEETDVIVTSVETMPQDIQEADQEQSEYEEKSKGGYRDEQWGSRKVYRVMMKSSDVESAKEKIYELLRNYKITQASTVKPGMNVPGGVYFNLFVPRDSLIDFLSKVGHVEDSSIFVSKTSKESPSGKTKVFIWIKEI